MPHAAWPGRTCAARPVGACTDWNSIETFFGQGARVSSPLRYRLEVAKVFLGTGILTPVRPDRAVRSVMALKRWGPTPAAAYTGSAARFPDRAALIDERGTLTFEEVHLRTNALAREMRAAGIKEGDSVAIMCRNHRGFIEATLACSKLGASALYPEHRFRRPADHRRDASRGSDGAGVRRRFRQPRR